MCQTELVLLVVTMALQASPSLGQEASIGSKGSFAGEPTQAAHVLRGHKYPVGAVAISPDMKSIASGGGENKEPRGQGITTFSVKELNDLTRGEGMVWDVKTAKRKAILQPAPGNVIGLSFNNNGKVIGGCLRNSPYAGGRPQHPTVVFWDATKGKVANQYLGLNTPEALSFSADGKVVVVAGGFRDPDTITTGPFGQNALVQNPKHGNVIRLMQYPALKVIQQIDIVGKNSGAMYTDSRYVAYHEGQTVHIVDITTGKETTVIPEATVGAMRISPDGKVLALLGENRSEKHSLQFLSVETGAAIGNPAFVVSTWSKAYAFSADSKWLAIATGWAGDESLICLWNIAERKEIARYVGHVGNVSSLAFSGDGSFLVSGGIDKTVRIWKLPAK